jgi:hypothetical protein
MFQPLCVISRQTSLRQSLPVRFRYERRTGPTGPPPILSGKQQLCGVQKPNEAEVYYRQNEVSFPGASAAIKLSIHFLLDHYSDTLALEAGHLRPCNDNCEVLRHVAE